MKEKIIIGLIALQILAISCNGKVSAQSSSSTSNNGRISAVFALEAFKKTKKLNGVLVPDVEAITNAINGLSSSVIDELTQNYSSPYGAFQYDFTADKKGVAIRKYNNNNTTVVIVPATIEGITVTEIQKGAFDFLNLVGVVLPETIIKIGGKNKDDSTFPLTFSSSLVAVNFPANLKEIGNEAFYYCENLTSVNLPEGLEKLGDGAFKLCKKLTKVTFPTSLKEIGYEAFYFCENLTSANLPEGLNKLGIRAFANCNRLSSITLPSSLQVIPEYAFWHTRIVNLIVPEGVGIINGGAFGECYNLITVTLPSTIKEIHHTGTWNYSGAFYNCSNLTDIIIPDSVKSISFINHSSSVSRDSFEGCGKLKLMVRQRIMDLGYKGVF